MLIRILIVDDDPLMVELITRFIEPMCSFVDSTGDLREAIEKVEHGSFNVVLLDLNLASSGKQEAFAAIRFMKSCRTSVVVISGIPDEHLKEDALAAGAAAFVAKGGNLDSHKLLLAANIAVLHLPRDSFKSESFTEHVNILRQMAAA